MTTFFRTWVSPSALLVMVCFSGCTTCSGWMNSGCGTSCDTYCDAASDPSCQRNCDSSVMQGCADQNSGLLGALGDKHKDRQANRNQRQTLRANGNCQDSGGIVQRGKAACSNACWKLCGCWYKKSNAIPQTLPLGSTIRAFDQVMETNAEAVDFIIHRHDFVTQTARLTPDGRDKIVEIAARMSSAPFPVIIERSENNSNPELDSLRRNLVAQVLLDFGHADAQQRTIGGACLWTRDYWTAWRTDLLPAYWSWEQRIQWIRWRKRQQFWGWIRRWIWRRRWIRWKLLAHIKRGQSVWDASSML